MPKIAVSVRYPGTAELEYKNQLFLEAIRKFGGQPVEARYWQKPDPEELAEVCDGLLLTGGEDLGDVPDRDDFERKLLFAFLERSKPVFGICRGVQLIAKMLGGDVHQDIGEHHRGLACEDGQGCHRVEILEGTKLYKILGERELRVNSTHHQAVKVIPDGFTICAVSLHEKDQEKIIEAIEPQDDRFILGVQWHPERLLATGSQTEKEQAGKLFRAFLAACSEQ